MRVNRRQIGFMVAFGFTAGFGLTVALASVSTAQTLQIGAYPTNPPFEFKNANGQFEGFEVDIVKEAAKRVGLTPEIADYGFQALFSSLASGRIEVAISSITITPERLKSLSFSQPYYDADMGVAVKLESPLRRVADLKGKTVGVLSGSTGEKWVQDNRAATGIADSKGYNAQQDMLLDLSAGRIDAAISNAPGMEYSFQKMTGLAVKELIKTNEQYGLMLAKNSPLLGKLNDAISSMKQDGALAAFHKKWFGSDAPVDSSTVKILPLPK